MKNTNNLVKKHQSYWLLLFAVLVCGTLQAKVDNYVGAYANLGEWTFLPSQSKYGASFGITGGGGFVYELQAGSKYSKTRFLFDVGVGAMGGMTSFAQGSSAGATLKDQIDLDGELFDYVYEIKNRHDQYRDVALQVPLMIGFQHGKVYALAGVKVYSHIYTKSHTTALLSTYGKYEDFEDFRSMPEYQFFTDRPVSGGIKTSLKLDLDVSLEVGGRLGVVTDAVGFDVPKRKIEYRLAGFFDYGLLDLHYAMDKPSLGTLDGNGNPITLENNLRYNEGATAPVYNTTTMVDNLALTDIMSTSGFASKINNLIIGLKFTILFQLPEEGQCVICRDGYRSLARRRGRRGGMKYEE